MKLNYKRTILVGFAFFLISAFWQAYDATIPVILTNKFGMSQTWSGVIMALDNILALFMLPLFGALSDKCTAKEAYNIRIPCHYRADRKCDKCKGVNKMERLTRPTVEVDETAAKYMGSFPVDIRTYKDRLLELILNGPTLNGVSKDALRQIIRQLYGALKAYEDIGLEPWEIEQTLMNFSSFLGEMTGGRMMPLTPTSRAFCGAAENVCSGR